MQFYVDLPAVLRLPIADPDQGPALITVREYLERSLKLFLQARNPFGTERVVAETYREALAGTLIRAGYLDGLDDENNFRFDNQQFNMIVNALIDEMCAGENS